MRYILVVLCILGIAAAALALREHYRDPGESVCDINDHWDCGIVNHSPYAVFPSNSPHGIPVAVIGIVGYVVLGGLAFKRSYKIMLALAIPALGFSIYLAHIEQRVLEVWCLYCAISLGVISLIALLLLVTVVMGLVRRSQAQTSP